MSKRSELRMAWLNAGLSGVLVYAASLARRERGRHGRRGRRREGDRLIATLTAQAVRARGGASRHDGRGERVGLTWRLDRLGQVPEWLSERFEESWAAARGGWVVTA